MAFAQRMNMSGFQNICSSTMDPQMFAHDLPMEADLGEDYNIDPYLRSMVVPTSSWSGQSISHWGGHQEKSFYLEGHLLPFQSRGLQMELSVPYEAQSPIPYALELPGRSPCRSPGESSYSGDTSSSHGDEEWCADMKNEHSACDHTILTHPGEQSNRAHFQSWFATYALPGAQTVGHITLRDVQRFQEPPQEMTFQDDEGYATSTVKNGYNNDYDSQPPSSNQREPSQFEDDETVGQNTSGNVTNNDVIRRTQDDVNFKEEDDDAELDAEQEILNNGSDGDTDYSPRSLRPKPRRTSRATTSSSTIKRTKVTKSTSRSKASFHCKTQGCRHTAKDIQALIRHVATAHTRPFVCSFGFAGCTGTFGSKNEWKRHVSSQHLALNYWRCDLGQCGRSRSCAPSSGTSSSRGSEFNRKDLFTQHLRRMHAPFAVKRQNKKSNDWDMQVKKLQTECVRTRRQPPTRTMCPVESCSLVFEGHNCWDARMEHVGKHFERAANKKVADTIIEEGNDTYLVDYALREHIIEEKGGKYQLSRGYHIGTDEDVDAECELE